MNIQFMQMREIDDMTLRNKESQIFNFKGLYAQKGILSKKKFMINL